MLLKAAFTLTLALLGAALPTKDKASSSLPEPAYMGYAYASNYDLPAGPLEAIDGCQNLPTTTAADKVLYEPKFRCRFWADFKCHGFKHDSKDGSGIEGGGWVFLPEPAVHSYQCFASPSSEAEADAADA